MTNPVGKIDFHQTKQVFSTLLSFDAQKTESVVSIEQLAKEVFKVVKDSSQPQFSKRSLTQLSKKEINDFLNKRTPSELEGAQQYLQNYQGVSKEHVSQGVCKNGFVLFLQAIKTSSAAAIVASECREAVTGETSQLVGNSEGSWEAAVIETLENPSFSAEQTPPGQVLDAERHSSVSPKDISMPADVTLIASQGSVDRAHSSEEVKREPLGEAPVNDGISGQGNRSEENLGDRSAISISSESSVVRSDKPEREVQEQGHSLEQLEMSDSTPVTIPQHPDSLVQPSISVTQGPSISSHESVLLVKNVENKDRVIENRSTQKKKFLAIGFSMFFAGVLLAYYRKYVRQTWQTFFSK